MPPSPLARIWAAACQALMRLRGSLHRLDTLTAWERRGVSKWLTAIEVFCRRLALTEALKLACADWVQGARTAPSQRRARRPVLRFWSRPKRGRARIRLLGAPSSMRELWREQKRLALLARLKHARRRPPHLRLADRIDALQSFLDAPRAALRRLARKLNVTPKLTLTIAMRRVPSAAYIPPEHEAALDAHMWPLVLDSS